MQSPEPARERRVAPMTWRDVVRTCLPTGSVWGGLMLAWSVGPFVGFGLTDSGLPTVSEREVSSRELLVKLTACATGGALFGGIMSAVVALVARSARRTAHAAMRGEGPLALAEGERLLEDGPANHAGRGETVGGWLFLTDRRLAFLPHRLSFGLGGPVTLPLDEVAAASAATLYRVVPQALVVERTDGGVERFAVGSRGQAWADAIEEARRRAS